MLPKTPQGLDMVARYQNGNEDESGGASADRDDERQRFLQKQCHPSSTLAIIGPSYLVMFEGTGQLIVF